MIGIFVSKKVEVDCTIFSQIAPERTPTCFCAQAVKLNTINAVQITMPKWYLKHSVIIYKIREQHPLWMLLPAVLFKIALNYETSMALVTFCFGSIFGMVTVRMPSSTLAEIWSRTTSSGSV